MTEINTSENAAPGTVERQKKKGFAVGPANLPDGRHKRQVQKIKRSLIEKAQIKKQYARVLRDHGIDSKIDGLTAATTNSAVHPARQAMMEEPRPTDSSIIVTKRHAKPDPFRSERAEAEQKQATRSARQQQIEELRQQRQARQADYERFRHRLDKARRPDRKGQRRLGRESKLLPGMVQHVLDKIERQKQEQ